MQVVKVNINITMISGHVFFSNEWQRVCMTSFALRALNDITLTALLCHHLERSKNGLRQYGKFESGM